MKILVMLFVLLLSSPLAVHANEETDFFSKINVLAQGNNARAQYHLGMLYNNGIGVQKDQKEAFKWFLKAAEAGDALAAYKVGCYYAGQAKGVVETDEDKAMVYKRTSAEAGYSFAQHDLANMSYEKGKFDEALKWWKMAAEQGYPLSLYNLSSLYLEGQQVKKDLKLAYAYFVLAKITAGQKLNDTAQATLDELKTKMTKQEIVEADKLIADWKPKPTALTQRALSGARDAETLLLK